MTFAGDFETTVDPHDCRVWAWGLLALEGEDFLVGELADELFEYLGMYPKVTVYFHNLKFDGQFILDWLFKHGLEFIRAQEVTADGERRKRKLMAGQFTTSISDQGIFYMIEIRLPNGSNIIFKNSLNLIPMAVEDIPDAFGLSYQKLHIDYEVQHLPGQGFTAQELAYLKQDCLIVRDALRVLHSLNMDRMTTASNALEFYKKMIGYRQFKRWFPPPYYDAAIRRAYKGGFTYINPQFIGKDIGPGMILDENSIYGYVMHEKPLPYGEGKLFEGQYQPDPEYPLYTQHLRAIFDLKPGMLPTIQVKNKYSQFRPTEYLYSSGGDEVDLTLTSIDLEVFFAHYDVVVIEWVNGWKFRAGTKMFREYIDYWMQIKVKGEQEGKPGLRTVAKQMIVSLYGKFGMKTVIQERTPYLDDWGVVQYRLEDPDPKEPIYVPIAVFVTAWARKILIEAIQQLGERFVYCATDSLHLIGWEKPDCLELDQYRLGAWKIEGYFEKARYLRPNAYVTMLDGKLDITCSNLQKRAYDLKETYKDHPEKLKLVPKGCQTKVTWDNFKYGTSYYGNLTPRKVAGGIVLEETVFTLKKVD